MWTLKNKEEQEVKVTQFLLRGTSKTIVLINMCLLKLETNTNFLKKFVKQYHLRKQTKKPQRCHEKGKMNVIFGFWYGPGADVS